MPPGIKTGRGKQSPSMLIIERRPLKLEEQQLGLQLGAELFGFLQQRSSRWIGGVRAELEAGVRRRPARQVLNSLKLSHRFRELVGAQVGNVARVAFLQRGRRAARFV